MLALLIWCGPCISYAAPSHLLLQFYASLVPLRNDVVHVCLVHTSSMWNPIHVSSIQRLHIVYASSMYYRSISAMHPLSRHQLGIAFASSMHLLCIIHVSCRGHMNIMYITIIYLPSMCHLRTSSALSMYRLRTISASSIHRLCVIYAPDYTIYVPSMHHLSIINASTWCLSTNSVSSLHFQCIIYVSSVYHRCIT